MTHDDFVFSDLAEDWKRVALDCEEKLPSKGHIYRPDKVDELIDVLNRELDDETKMKLVFAMPLLGRYLAPTDL